MDQAAQNYGFVGYQQQKPIIMGEYGAFKWLTHWLQMQPRGAKLANSVLRLQFQRLAALSGTRTNNPSFEWAIQRRAINLPCSRIKAKPMFSLTLWRIRKKAALRRTSCLGTQCR